MPGRNIGEAITLVPALGHPEIASQQRPGANHKSSSDCSRSPTQVFRMLPGLASTLLRRLSRSNARGPFGPLDEAYAPEKWS